VLSIFKRHTTNNARKIKNNFTLYLRDVDGQQQCWPYDTLDMPSAPPITTLPSGGGEGGGGGGVEEGEGETAAHVNILTPSHKGHRGCNHIFAVVAVVARFPGFSLATIEAASQLEMKLDWSWSWCRCPGNIEV